VNVLAGDTLESIRNIRDTMELTFPIVKDSVGLFSCFNFEGTPATIIIDRYGMIALAEEGAVIGTRYWTNGFDYFIDENYKRGVIESIESVSPMIKPDVEMSPVEEIESAFNGEGDITVGYRPETEGNNVEYIWPFITDTKGDKTVIRPSNNDIDNSTAIIYADVSLKKGQAVLFDYFSSTHYDVNNGTADILYVIVDGKDMYSISGLSDSWVSETDDGWRTCCPYVALEDGTYSIAFCYVKDMADKDGDDTVYLDNLRVVDKSDVNIDTYIYRYAANKPNEYNTGFESYAEVVLGDDGYYHVGTKDGPILLANLMGYTKFENNNYVSNRLYMNMDGTFIVNGVNKYNSLERYCNYASNSLMQGYCSVTEELKDLLVAYVEMYRSEIGYSEDENLWLTLCAYYDAYGTEGKQMEDPIKGLASFSAYEAVESPVNENGDVTELELNHLKYDKILVPRGYLYKFTPTKSGVYRVLSMLENQDETEAIPGIMGNIFVGNHEEWSLLVGEGVARTQYADSEYAERFVKELLVDRNGDGIPERDELNCTMAAYMEAGKDYYITLYFRNPAAFGEFDFIVKYLDETYDAFREASLGAFTFIEGPPDENGQPTVGDTITGGIEVVLGEDGLYYHKIGVDSEGKAILGSVIYADFIWTTNIFPTRTMQQLINAHSFDFSKTEDDLLVLAIYNAYARNGFSNEWLAEFEQKWTNELLPALESDIAKWNKELEDEWNSENLAEKYGEDKKAEYIEQGVKVKLESEKKKCRTEFDDAKWNSIPELQMIADGMYTKTYYNSELEDKYEKYGLAGLREYWGTDYEAAWELYQVEDVLSGEFNGSGANYTDRMQEIYDENIKYVYDDNGNLTIEFDKEHPEMQGCVAVTAELAELLQMLMDKYSFYGVENSWTKLCYYYDYLGPKA